MFRVTTVIAALFVCFLGMSLDVSESSAGENDLQRSTASVLALASIGHCEVPCGIYDDHAEIRRMLLDAETMRKAAAQIGQLAERIDAASLNTISRWVAVKEEHSRNIQHVNAWYFMSQRINPVTSGSDGLKAYHLNQTHPHAVSVAPMKAAQSL